MRLHDTYLERGQVLVIFAGGLIALIAVAALVVDLGFVFMLRRQEQDAADPGAVAAARYIRPTANPASMWTAACTYALQNGFSPTRTDTGAPCDPSTPVDGSQITVNYPPSPAAGEFAGRRGYVEVAISKPHSSFFAGALGLLQIQVSTSAVAAFDTGTAGSSSLIALSSKACSGEAAAKVNGGGSGGGIRIFPATGVTDPGGYIQVNSTCGIGLAGDDVCTSGNSGAFMLDGGAVVDAPALYVAGGCVIKGGSGTANIDMTDEGASYVGDPLALVRPPSPADLPTRSCPSGTAGTPSNPKTCKLSGTLTLQPGTYYGGWNIQNSADITLQPGIYIMAGGGITQTGGTLTSASGRVLIYGTDAPAFQAACVGGSGNNAQCQQDIDLSGTGSVMLTGLARDQGCPPYGITTCPYGGLLVWQDATASGAYQGKADVQVGGGTSFQLAGTIYSAGGNVTVIGNSITSGCDASLIDKNCAAIQIIADTFQVGGAAMLDMPYDPNGFYQLNLKGLVK